MDFRSLGFFYNFECFLIFKFALKGVVLTNYPATTEPHGLRRPKSTNALMARSRSKRHRHDPPACCAHAAKWPGGRATEQRGELAPPHHSITSSARASKVGGASSPNALGPTK
jgi:hypothetical protein